MNATANKLQDTMFLAGYHKLSIIPVGKNKIPTLENGNYQTRKADIRNV